MSYSHYNPCCIIRQCCIIMIHMNKGRKIVVCARAGGANTTSFLAAHFAKQDTKFGGRKRGRAKIPPPNPFPFCPPERFGFAREARRHSEFCSKNVRTSSKKHRQKPKIRARGFLVFGGGWRIRTSERFPSTGFQDQRYRPLSQPSVIMRGKIVSFPSPFHSLGTSHWSPPIRCFPSRLH